ACERIIWRIASIASSSINRLFCTTREIRWWQANRGYFNLRQNLLLMCRLKHMRILCQCCNDQNI
ncbi:MAG: hypothetical protein JJT96_19645, partial [Opitutales bacterium]|nr:hypothetical protein [Opitutales bacterium]